MLPCSPAGFDRPSSALPADALHGKSSTVRTRSLRALVVEDTDDTRELYTTELERAGFVVAQAGSGDEGLRLLHEFDPDVVLLDLMLPGVNGFGVARAARAWEGYSGRLVIVAITALTSDVMRRTASEAGCDAVLCKPVEPSIVIDTACSLLERIDRF